MSLRVRDASFGYGGGGLVFDHLGLDVAGGEVLCILGPNGCGKTTLLKCCAGLLAPASGDVSIGGVSLGQLDRRAVARRVGYVPQSHDAVFPYSVRDVVLMGRTPHLSAWASPADGDLAMADAAIERVGLTMKAAHSYATLSGGERQLALVARALCQAPSLLLMDEPVAHLDLRNQAVVLRLVARLAAEGASVVFSTHDPAHAARVATRVALMHARGRLTIGPASEALTPAFLSDAYGTSVALAGARWEAEG